MHDRAEITDTRLKRLLDRVVRPAIETATAPLDLEAFHVAGEPVSHDVAVAAEFEPFDVDAPWGGMWDTTWFRLRGKVPQAWVDAGDEVSIAFGIRDAGHTGFGAEALVWVDGAPVQGLSPNHQYVRLGAGAETVDVLVEAAANPRGPFGTDRWPLLDADPGGAPMCRLSRAELVVRRPEVEALARDLEVLIGLVRSLDDADPRAATTRRGVEAACDLLDPDDVAGTATAVREALAPLLRTRSGPPTHTVTAVGHAHIDTAWLWPLRETVRKCARTFSTACDLLDRHPEHRFVISQAQQWAWMRDHYPALYERMKAHVAAGRIEPVGSMWVEADCNVPSGESLVRQLVHGKRFFLEELGVETEDCWLPDVFGYAASLPQLLQQAGVRWFLTQKISWNQTNDFPHHTFWWQGIDGTRLFTHFPPANTYNGVVTTEQVVAAERRFRDHGHSARSLYPFGYGDGGGGPTEEMLERAARLTDLDGAPKVELGTVKGFFTEAEAEASDLATWVGELYLELHRGTYTTHADVKAGNRRGELGLREAELWAAVAPAASDDYPHDRLDAAWKDLLLQQFHDILPGSSIHWVYEDAADAHERVVATASGIAARAADDLAALVDVGDAADPVVVFNPAPHDRLDLVDIGGVRRQVVVPALGWTVTDAAVVPQPPAQPVTAGDGWMDNGILRVEWDDAGLLTSILDRRVDREVLASGQRGNLLQLHDDRPNDWDGWDVDPFYRRRVHDLTTADDVELTEDGPWRSELTVTRTTPGGRSTIVQRIRLTAGSARLDVETEVDWHEERKLLKAAFPVAVHSSRASFEIQYGHVERPTHENTSWDAARFEVCAHKWVDLSEAGYGVALLNDSKYGYDVVGDALRLTLLRAPLWPDPLADRGHHTFTYSLFPHEGDLRDGGVIAEAYALNVPVRLVRVPAGTKGTLPATGSVVAVDDPGTVVEVVKRADRDDAWVVRLYESFGGRRRVRVTFDGLAALHGAVTSCHRADLLERPADEVPIVDGGVDLVLRPFEVTTLLLRT